MGSEEKEKRLCLQLLPFTPGANMPPCWVPPRWQYGVVFPHLYLREVKVQQEASWDLREETEQRLEGGKYENTKEKGVCEG